jgi:hypothetical protein
MRVLIFNVQEDQQGLLEYFSYGCCNIKGWIFMAPQGSPHPIKNNITSLLILNGRWVSASLENTQAFTKMWRKVVLKRNIRH